MDFDALIDRARGLAASGARAVLGIAGSPGAGKTTLATALIEALATDPPAGAESGDWVAHVPMDGFHLADVELNRLGRLSRKGAPDTFDAAGYAALLKRLRGDPAQVVYAPAFERVIEQPIAGSIPVGPEVRLVITEGNYLLLEEGDWGRVRPELDEVWFCDLGEAERRRRLVHRHTSYGKSHQHAVEWVHDVDERNAELIETTRGAADLILSSSALRSIGASA
jgi:pantothenate kinase